MFDFQFLANTLDFINNSWQFIIGIPFIGLILTVLVSLAAYPALPDQIITHWNAAGEPDGSMGKLAGTGLVPLIMVALAGLLLFLPRIDPLRKNYDA